MISLTEQSLACAKTNNQMQSLGRVGKVAIVLIKIIPFPIVKKRTDAIKLFLLTVSSRSLFIFPSHTTDSGGVKRKEKT